MVALSRRSSHSGTEMSVRASSESINTERTSNSIMTTTTVNNTVKSAESHTDRMQEEEFSELRESMLDSEYM